MSSAPLPPDAELEFNFLEALLKQPAIVLELTKSLDIKTLISLLSVSKKLRSILQSHLTSIIRFVTDTHAPAAGSVYRFKAYRSLCVEDETGRTNAETGAKPRLVPSLRWLQMVLSREKKVNEMIAALAVQSHRLPPSAATVFHKIWMFMDFDTNARRLSFVQGSFWSDEEIFIAVLIFVKLQMVFTDPIESDSQYPVFIAFLLGQPSLTDLWLAVAHPRDRRTRRRILEMTVRHSFKPLLYPNKKILGVPVEECGVGNVEKHTKQPLMTADELVMREAIRRDIPVEECLRSMLTYGYIDLMGVPLSEKDKEGKFHCKPVEH